VLSIAQIRAGYSQLKESIMNMKWNSMFDYLGFSLMKGLPLMKEITTTVRFCASNTSLNYFEWIKLEDISGDLLEAKYQSERKIIHNPVGKKIGSFMHVCVGIVAFLMVVVA